MVSGNVFWAINTDNVPEMAKAIERNDGFELRARKNMTPASIGQMSQNIQRETFFDLKRNCDPLSLGRLPEA